MKIVVKILLCSLLFVTLGFSCFAHSVVNTSGTVYYSRYPIRNIISRVGIETIQYTERMVYNSTRASGDSYSSVNFEGISTEYNIYEDRLYLGYMRPSATVDYFDFSNSLAYKENSSRYFPLSTLYIVPSGCSLNVECSGVYSLYFNDSGNVSSYSINMSDFLNPIKTGLYSLEVYGNTLNYLQGMLTNRDYDIYLLDIEGALVSYLDSYSGIPVGVFASSVGYGLTDVSVTCTCVDSSGNALPYLYAIDSYELFDTRVAVDSSVTSAVLNDSVDSFSYDNIGSERDSLLRSLAIAFDNDFVLGFSYIELLYLVFAVTVLSYVLKLILGG